MQIIHYRRMDAIWDIFTGHHIYEKRTVVQTIMQILYLVLTAAVPILLL